MSLNKNDRNGIEKKAESENYSWNSNASKMTNGSKTVTFSSTGQSVSINGSIYNSPGSAKNSKNW